MINKTNFKSLIITITFLFILPFVQKQWLNLYLFNFNEITIYSILYYLSGIICPSLIFFYSLNNFTNYKFNKNNINKAKIINGKSLLFIVAIVLIFLSYLIADYFYINLDLITNLFIEKIELNKPDIFNLSIYISFIAIFLIFKKSRLLFKKLILVNFILISFSIWYMKINNINVDDQFQIFKYYELNNINLINVSILLAIEIFYFIWSYLSYKSNLSDWIICIPNKYAMIPFLKIIFFYFFIIFYYAVLS